MMVPEGVPMLIARIYTALCAAIVLIAAAAPAVATPSGKASPQSQTRCVKQACWLERFFAPSVPAARPSSIPAGVAQQRPAPSYIVLQLGIGF
ncbi:MAG TPA: hypothetical protein VM867_01890 [Xanthobacteraceae bacterium]|nr:hypothetical protein [Xanthobacteraceae bacterium]